MESMLEIRPGRFIHLTLHKNANAAETLFLIHGLGGRGDQWREQIPALKKQYTLVIPDLLGLGQSAKPKSSQHNLYSFTELNKDIQAVFQQFSSEKNSIIGHSYGGALALMQAMQYPQKIQKLILIDPTPCEAKLQLPFIFRLPTFLFSILHPLLEKGFQATAFDASTSPALITEEIQAGRLNAMHVIKDMVTGMKDMPTVDVSQISIPSLIIIGASDHVISPSKIENFYKTIPNHQFVTIPHASHMVMLEKPNEINQIIINFLAKKSVNSSPQK